MRLDNKLFIVFIFLFFSCQKEDEIKTVVYKKGNVINEFYGSFYSDKYGGLNYYISNEKERDIFFNIKDADSIILTINKKNYVSEPLIDKPYSREINNSDFSFFINEKEHKIIIDTISNKNTVLFISAKTDMEKLKDNKLIKFTYIE